MIKSLLATAAGCAAGLLLGYAIKAGIQWYACMAYGLFGETYCVLQVLMR